MYKEHFYLQFFSHPSDKEMSLIIKQHRQRDREKAERCPTSRVFFTRSLCLSSPVPPVDGPGPLNQRPPHGSLPPSWLVQISPKMPVGQWAVSLGVPPSLLSWSHWVKSERRRRKIMRSIYYFCLMGITAALIYSPHALISDFTLMLFFSVLIILSTFLWTVCI